MARPVYLVGSVPMASAEEVFTRVGGALGPYLKWLPDGETGADPLAPALGATMGASMGFMLPVSTPCNAIVYGSGRIPLAKMMRYGALLDVAGVIVIIAFVKLLLPLVR